ncbi:MAG: alpha/beta hydrolase [Actinomycetota bacterium]
MPHVARNEYDLYHQATGPPDGPTLVLVAGLGEQIGSVEYPEEQCEAFARRGFRVVRMDNRTMGHSQPHSGVSPQPFTQQDLADDVAAVIDDLDVGPVHLVGASMGGAIVRWTTLRHPDRVATLTVVMASAGGDPDDPTSPTRPPDSGPRLLAMGERRERDEAIDFTVETWRWLWGGRYPFEEAWVRERVTAAHDRNYNPEGIQLMLRSLAGGPFLREAQAAIACPTLVMHGGDDPVFGEEHGRDIAERIPGAQLWLDPKMGHIMHREQWEEMADRVAFLAGIDGA